MKAYAEDADAGLVCFVLDDESEAIDLVNFVESRRREYEQGTFGWRVYRRIGGRLKELLRSDNWPMELRMTRDDACMLKQALQSHGRTEGVYAAITDAPI